MADSLPKTVENFTSKEKCIVSPPIPVGGKDRSNMVMADSLPEIIENPRARKKY